FLGEGIKHLARRSDTDRWLFVVTLVLCLMGAVMIFSASAVTAQNQFGHSYYFVVRQIAWLMIGLLGMFALMKLDYHRLREPAVVYTVLCLVLIMTAILFVAGLSWKWLAVGAFTALPLLIFSVTHVSYRMARLMAFLHPDNDPQGAGF